MTIIFSKVVAPSKALNVWYDKFGPVASTLDILVLVLAIALAKFSMPAASGVVLIGVALVIQIIHDVVFGGIIVGLPKGHNELMDIFKSYYTRDTGYWILLADAVLISSSVFLMEWLEENLSPDWITFLGILAVYSLLYILYTR